MLPVKTERPCESKSWSRCDWVIVSRLEPSCFGRFCLDTFVIVDFAIGAHLARNAEDIEHEILEAHHVGSEERGPLDHLGRDLALETEEERHPERQREHRHVDGELPEASREATGSA